MKAATFLVITTKRLIDVSIHAAREGGDVYGGTLPAALQEFQSTPPVKAATSRKPLKRLLALVSIHAAREGGDIMRFFSRRPMPCFNPRRP